MAVNPQITQPAAPTPRPSPQEKPGGNRTLLLFFIGIAVLVALFAIGIIPRLRHNRALAQETKEQAGQLPQVPTITPHPATESELTLPGTTQAIADTVVSARTSGYLSKRYVDIGARVKAGQLLAEIQSPEVDQQLLQADAQTAQSQAAIQQAQADVASKQAVVIQYQSNVQQASANLEQARAQVSNAQAKVAQLQAAQSQAEAQLGQTRQQVDIKEAALKQATTQRDLASVTLNRYQSLLKQGFVALQDVDQNKATYDNAVSAVNSAQSDVSAAQKNVAASQANVRAAQANVVAGRAEVRAAQKNAKAIAATIRSAQATVEAARAGVRQSASNVQASQFAARANQANGKRFQVLTSFEKVTAPFAGVITARNVDVGVLVSAGGTNSASSTPTASTTGSLTNAGSASTATATPTTTPSGGLFGLARTDVLRILIAVPQAYARLMRTGLPAHITIAEFPGRTFDGVVARASGAIDTSSRTLLTEVHLPNRDNTLLPGTYTQVHFDLPRETGALRVPASTVIFDAQGSRVAVIGEGNKVHYVPVKIGRDFGQELEITEGLTGKETLALSPSDDLVEGAAVQPVAAPPPPAEPGGAPKPDKPKS